MAEPTESTTEVLFAGRAYCDLVFAGVGTPSAGREVFSDGFALSAGGAATSAVAAARLGARSSLLTEFGDDPLGCLIRSELAREPHLDLSRCQDIPGYQSPVTVAITAGADRSFVTYQQTTTGVSWPEGGGSVGAVHVALHPELPEWVRRLRNAGSLVVAGTSWDPTGLWSAEDLKGLSEADAFIANDLEAMHYTGTQSVDEAVKVLGQHVGLVVVTRGRQGVIALDTGSGSVVGVPAVPVPALDPTGAGDIFAAAFMVATVWGWPLLERLRLAVIAGSRSVCTLGGARSAPTPADLLAFLTDRRPAGDWDFVNQWARKVSKEGESGGSATDALATLNHRE